MEISRFDAGQEALRLEDVDLRSLVEAVVRTRGWTDRVPWRPARSCSPPTAGGSSGSSPT